MAAAIDITREQIRDSLRDASIPALIATVVQLTGDAGLLRPEWRIATNFIDGLQTELPDAAKADIMRIAEDAIARRLIDGEQAAPLPDEAVLRRMMDFVTGEEIPESYIPFLQQEIRDTEDDPLRPAWRVPAGSTVSAIVIGAGMSGLLAALRLRQAGVVVTVFEKNDDVGGTWLSNSYPGCRVDNPNHLYSYSFAPNHDWPQYFSAQPQLLRYFREIAQQHDLLPDIRFGTTVQEARWDAAAAIWRVTTIDRDGGITVAEAHFVIAAVGQLSSPRYPDIAGLESFAGPAFHSAEWRHDVDLTGKRVAVIGTGASACQFVPAIAPDVAQLTVFQRSAPWLGHSPDYHKAVTAGKKWLLKHVPFYAKWYRFSLFWMAADGVWPMVRKDPDWNADDGTLNAGHRRLTRELTRTLTDQAGDDPDLLRAVLPGYVAGGKRILRDNGSWIATLKRPNVALVTEAIDRVDEDAIHTSDGQSRPFDVIIHGTGFAATQFLKGIDVIGDGGRTLHDSWNGDARAYLGMMVPGFPNFFMLYGPNTNIVVSGSIIFFSECAVQYVSETIRMVVDAGASAFSLREQAFAHFNERLDAANAEMAWGLPGVTNWYRNAAGRVSQNWPWPVMDYWTATRAPDPSAFILT